MIVVDEMLAEMDALDPDRLKCEWDREFLREVGYLPPFSPFVRIEMRRHVQDRIYQPHDWSTYGGRVFGQPGQIIQCSPPYLGRGILF